MKPRIVSAHRFGFDAHPRCPAHGRRRVRQASARHRGGYVSAMQANQFQAMGVTRSYFDFYRGLGLGITILLTAEGGRVLAARRACQERCRPAAARLGHVSARATWLWPSIRTRIFSSGPVIAEVLIALCVWDGDGHSQGALRRDTRVSWPRTGPERVSYRVDSLRARKRARSRPSARVY